MSVSIHDDIDKFICDYKVAMIMKKTCPFCKKAKRILDSYKMSGTCHQKILSLNFRKKDNLSLMQLIWLSTISRGHF